MKINKPYNISGAHQLGKSSNKGAKVESVSNETVQSSGLKLSGSASFVQTMREAAMSVGIRADVVTQAQQDIDNQTLGSEIDYNQAVTALLVEL